MLKTGATDLEVHGQRTRKGEDEFTRAHAGSSGERRCQEFAGRKQHKDSERADCHRGRRRDVGEVYAGFYERILGQMDTSLPGLIVEVGSGVGEPEVSGHWLSSSVVAVDW